MIAQPVDIFVGRSEEQRIFRGMLDARRGTHVFEILGEAGIGKTQLLLRFEEICKQEGVPNVAMVDFYETINRNEIGLLENLSRLLGPMNFPHFVDALNSLRRLEITPGAAIDLWESAMRLVEDSFIGDCNRLAIAQQRPIVLLCDTLEEVRDPGFEEWFLFNVLDRLEWAVIIVTGRRKLYVGERANLVRRKLEEFTLQETKKYFEKRARQEGQIVELPMRESQRTHELSEGRPLLVVVAAEWLLRENWQIPLSVTDRDSFEDALMAYLTRSIGQPRLQVITCMAHVYRRFDHAVLDSLHLDLAPYSDSIELITDLVDCPFVKYRPLSGSCLLHDEMRELIVKKIWNPIDPPPMMNERKELSAKAIAYYDDDIQSEKNEQERQALRSEQLFYQLHLDFEHYFEQFKDMFDKAFDSPNLALCRSLLEEVERYAETYGGLSG